MDLGGTVLVPYLFPVRGLVVPLPAKDERGADGRVTTPAEPPVRDGRDEFV